MLNVITPANRVTSPAAPKEPRTPPHSEAFLWQEMVVPWDHPSRVLYVVMGSVTGVITYHLASRPPSKKCWPGPASGAARKRSGSNATPGLSAASSPATLNPCAM